METLCIFISISGQSVYQVIQGYVEAALSGQQITYETWVSYKNGRARYISAIYVPDFDDVEKVKGFLLWSPITRREKRWKNS